MDPATGQLYPGIFSSKQRYFSIISFGLYQFVFYFAIALVLYTVCTLNFKILLLALGITLAQLPVNRNQTYIDWMKKYVTPLRYFKKFQIQYEEAISDQQKCLFGFHPHSVFALGFLGSMNYRNDAMSRMVGLSSRFMLNFPFTGLLLKLWGVQAVHQDNLKMLMQSNHNIGLLPGGFQEATLTTPKSFRAFINSRKGFIKYAIQFGYTIYPVAVLNEHRSFWTFDYFLPLRLLFNKFKFPGVYYFNPKSFIFCPVDLEIYIIVGKGIRTEKPLTGQSPTQQQIDAKHEEYVQELKRIYKYQYLNNNVALQIY